jgi:glycosyltransferase involved in cell wall biosynthesis
MKRKAAEGKVRVCHVSTAHTGLDDRIFWKECTSLAQAGYEVVLLAPEVPAGIIQGVSCIALRHESRRWIRPFMGFSILWTVLRLHPRVAHFHDPELIPVAATLRVFGLKTIYDAHEDLPKQLKQKDWAQRSVTRLAVRTLALWLERSLRRLSAVVYVVDGQTESRMTRRAVLVRNFPRQGLFAPSTTPRPPATLPLTVVYVGGLARARGIHELIDAVGMLPEGCVRFVLAGPWESSEFKDECQRSLGWGRVRSLDRLPHTEIPGLLRQADIGVHCPGRGPNMMRSIPVKVLEYMACGLPIVLTDIPFWHEMFGDTPIYVAQPDAPSIAAALTELIDDPAGRTERARQGVALLQANGWYWASESAKLIELYGDLCGGTHVAS